MDTKSHEYDLQVKGDFDFKVEGYKAPPISDGEIYTVPLRVKVKRSELTGEKNTIYFTLTARDNPDITVSQRTTFIGPSK
jgi:hypothetical protein